MPTGVSAVASPTALMPRDYARDGAAYSFLASGEHHHLEIGCGPGVFLAELARRYPDSRIVGIELDPVFAYKGVRSLARAEITAARITPGDARQILTEAQEGLAEQFDHIWLNFPDPWPKDRHAKNRLSNPAVFELIAAVCAPDGEVHLATDDAAFLADFDASAKWAGFSVHVAPRLSRADFSVETRYQRRWKEEGRALYFRDYHRASTPQEERPASLPRFHLEASVALDHLVSSVFRGSGRPNDAWHVEGWTLRKVGRRRAHGGIAVERYMFVQHDEGFCDRFDFDLDGNWINPGDVLPTREKVAALRRCLEAAAVVSPV